MHGNNDGYATGSKDGTVILWDNSFKPITKLEMINTPVGYEGDAMLKMFFKIPRHAIKLNMSALTPKSDKLVIFAHNITLESHIMVIRIKDMIPDGTNSACQHIR